MSRPRLFTDEDFSGTIVAAVRRRAPGLEVTTVVENDLSGATDDEVLEFAWENQFLVVSHDVSTMIASADARLSRGQDIHGLFIAPQSKPIRLVAESLILICEASEFEEWRNQIIYLPL